MVESPFALLAAIVAPAVMTNACSILTLGMSNRLGRVVDPTRTALTELGREDLRAVQRESLVGQMRDLRRRTGLLLSAQRWFFVALGSFAVVALLSVLSPLPVLWVIHGTTSTLALAAGAIGVFGLAWGS